MFSDAYRQRLRQQLDETRAAGLYKQERVLTTPQGSHVNAPPVLNLCANNYLGLSNDPGIVAAAREALERWGYGLASVRFICGTQQIHKELEKKLSEFLGTDDTLLYSSCFDANGGLFETLLGEQDAVISDELNHASIIDGIRLCKAQRYRYRNNDMADLEAKLREATGQKLIATDGVFSMDGIIANLPAICDLAEKHDALVMVDDSHAVGVLGEHGRGTHEHHRVMGRVDILTGTLGKALGGASGGYTSGHAEIIELLRQRSRPYLFSNSVAPMIVATSLAALDMVGPLRERLMENTRYFREKMNIPGEHPIVPIMIGDAARAVEIANRLLEQGIYVIAFSYPVVPKGKARIRVQISAAHTKEDLDFAVKKFRELL
jgi:glycine C-acetyltransferase